MKIVVIIGFHKPSLKIIQRFFYWVSYIGMLSYGVSTPYVYRLTFFIIGVEGWMEYILFKTLFQQYLIESPRRFFSHSNACLIFTKFSSICACANAFSTMRLRTG